MKITLSRREFLGISAAGFCSACLSACMCQPDPSPQAYWKTNRQVLVKNFDLILNPVRKTIIELCGERETKTILTESRSRYIALLPEVPYIGGDDNVLTETLYYAAVGLALYQVLHAHGHPLGDSGQILYRAIQAMLNFNDPLSSAQMSDPTGKAVQDEYRAIASWTEKSPYPGDWKAVFVEGNGRDFDFGIDYTECGIVKYYGAQDAQELTPYLCLGDFPISQAAGTGLVRTTTLARGGACCDFRFKAGRPIRMEWTPDFLQR